LLAAKICFEKKELFFQFVSQTFTLKAFGTLQIGTQFKAALFDLFDHLIEGLS